MSIRTNEIKHRERREVIKLYNHREKVIANAFEHRREWVHDLILDLLANEYWLTDFRELDNETVGERVKDVIKQIEDYIWDKY